MLEADTPLIEDIDAALRFSNAVISELKKAKQLEASDENYLWYSMALRNYQRNIVDAITRALRTIALDVDKNVPKQYEQLLEQLMAPKGTRPVFVSSASQQYLLLARNLSLAASLPIMPEDAKEDFEAQRKAASAMVKVMTYLIEEITNMRTWCMANLSPQ